jgi:hypothetical protein
MAAMKRPSALLKRHKNGYLPNKMVPLYGRCAMLWLCLVHRVHLNLLGLKMCRLVRQTSLG